MCQSPILASDYPKVPNDLFIKLEGCGFFRLLTSREEGILHWALCCSLVRFDPLCHVKKQCNNNMTKKNHFHWDQNPILYLERKQPIHCGVFLNKVSWSYYTRRGNVCCLFTRQKQTENRPVYSVSLITSLEFNITCHTVKHEIIIEAERPQKPLWTALLVRFQLMLQAAHLYKL